MATASDGGIPLPPRLNYPELSYDVWVRYMATGRRFLPSQILSEPTALLDDVIELDNLYNALKELQSDNSNE